MRLTSRTNEHAASWVKDRDVQHRSVTLTSFRLSVHRGLWPIVVYVYLLMIAGNRIKMSRKQPIYIRYLAWVIVLGVLSVATAAEDKSNLPAKADTSQRIRVFPDLQDSFERYKVHNQEGRLEKE